MFSCPSSSGTHHAKYHRFANILYMYPSENVIQKQRAYKA